LASPAPDRPAVSRGHLRRLLARIGLLQIDSVNVLARAHLMPVFSRLGDYPLEVFRAAAWPTKSADRLWVETWAHEASLVPVELSPYLRWERRHWSTNHAQRMQRDHPGLLEDVLAVVAAQGPCSAGQVEEQLASGSKGRPGWWEWSLAKQACEALFSAGRLGTAYRRGFERHYDLIERILPKRVLDIPTPTPAEAQRHLVNIAARAHGVGTVADIADYFRMPVVAARSAVVDLVEEGAVLPVAVEGWRETAYLHREAKVPRKVAGSALLCPFDPLVWQRSRSERIFGFHYRIEIYTPAPQRRFGYYVCPLLVGESLVGRLDLKAGRAEGQLLVQASWQEPGIDTAVAAEAAGRELRRMAGWLGLPEVVVKPVGNFWREVAAAVQSR
jgi:uncharacterized protein YcaQ